MPRVEGWTYTQTYKLIFGDPPQNSTIHWPFEAAASFVLTLFKLLASDRRLYLYISFRFLLPIGLQKTKDLVLAFDNTTAECGEPPNIENLYRIDHSLISNRRIG